MPYIIPQRRVDIDAMKIGNFTSKEPGELAYAIWRLVRNYFVRGRIAGYADRVVVLGILEGIKLEFHERILGPYEASKRANNGDVL